MAGSKLLHRQKLLSRKLVVGVVPINHLPAYARYLIHLDDPDKAQYDVHDVTALSGADYDAITYIPADDLSCIVDMLQFINVNQISSFSVFADICALEHKEWLRVLALKKTSYFFYSTLNQRHGLNHLFLTRRIYNYDVKCN